MFSSVLALSVCAWLLCNSFLCNGAYIPPAKYLIVSNARNGTIGYAKVPKSGNISQVYTLIDAGLGHPQGIAVDQKRQLLLVADSELRKVVSYGLSLTADGELVVDEQTPLAEDVDTRWVAVDGPGNVYMSDELNNRVLKISARQVMAGDTTPKVVFPKAMSSMSTLSAPGGVAADNFNVFWANKVNGDKLGTIVKALPVESNTTEVSMLEEQPVVLSQHLPKAYGVCIAIDNIFYTSPERHVHAVKTTGGDFVPVTSALQSPRGCTWDGHSTVYVADRTANGVFAFPGPMVSLSEAAAKRVMHFEDAFGVAVFSAASPQWRSNGLALYLAMLLFAMCCSRS